MDRWPKPATERQILDNLIDAALRTQGIVSIDSVRHTRRNLVGPLTTLLEGRVRRKELVPVAVEGGKSQALDRAGDPRSATGAWG